MTRTALLAPRLRLPRTGLAVLLDGRYPSGYSGGRFPLADGAALAQWNDVSGAGLHATQATAASQPKWFANGTVEFDGTDDSMTFPQTGILRNVTGATIYALVSSTATNTADRNAVIVPTDGANQNGLVLRRGGTGGLFIAGGRRVTTDSQVVATGSAIDGIGYRVLSLVANFAAGTFTSHINNAQDGSGSFTSAGSTSDVERSRPIDVGCRQTVEFWQGRIAAVAIYHAAHDATTRARVVEAARRGWGLTS